MRRARLSPHRRGYDRAWEKVRDAHLAAHPLCAWCSTATRPVAADVVDHITPIRDAPDRRLDPANLQSLCDTCHSKYKQQVETRGYHDMTDVDGWPIDPNHPANR